CEWLDQAHDAVKDVDEAEAVILRMQQRYLLDPAAKIVASAEILDTVERAAKTSAVLRRAGIGRLGVSTCGPTGASLHQVPIGPAAEALGQEIDEDADLDREVAAGRVDGVERQLRRLVLDEDAAQPALLQVGAGDEGRQERDAAAVHGGVAQDLGVVG